jgi:hypothetical protein
VGFSISWVAVKGKASEIALQDLDLVPTGERDELPAESPICGASLDDWFVVIFDRYEHELTRDDVVRILSQDCDVVTAGAEEHVMCSFATGWRNRERVWWAAHDAQKALDHLEAEGSLPDGFDALRRERLDEQAAAGGTETDVDYVFDVPLDAARLVTGFSHTETEPDAGFAVLTTASPPSAQ